jgi:bifunctional UDP-N-acetylglucosamine pyrophosphorylase / glucosamine-1-phosphate N-acetyltransferase
MRAPSLSAIVLAAGEGTRMRSQRPKPLHLLCGRPMLFYVLDSLSDVHVERTVVVVGHAAERVTKKIQEEGWPDQAIDFVEQTVQRGTGDAVSVGLTAWADEDPDDADTVIVLPGDAPLLRPSTVAALVKQHLTTGAAATLLTAKLEDPTGYGRILRGRDQRVARVVEQRDATPDELLVDEICTSIYCFRRNLLGPALRRLSPDNAQGEYYLTDVVAVLHDAGYHVGSFPADEPAETQGVNDRAQLADAEARLRRRTNNEWLDAGVTMVDPAQTYIDVTVQLAPDVTLFPGTILQGRTVIGRGCEIGPNARLVDTLVGPNAVVQQSVAVDAEVGEGAVVGPYAVLTPGDHVAPGIRTGAFYTAPGR